MGWRVSLQQPIMVTWGFPQWPIAGGSQQQSQLGGGGMSVVCAPLPAGALTPRGGTCPCYMSPGSSSCVFRNEAAWFGFDLTFGAVASFVGAWYICSDVARVHNELLDLGVLWELLGSIQHPTSPGLLPLQGPGTWLARFGKGKLVSGSLALCN